MKSLPDLLRSADPLVYEPRRSAQDRRMSRQRILDAPCLDEELPRRRVLIGTGVALMLLGITVGSHFWSRTVVDAAAIDFEVRLGEDTVVTNSDIAEAYVIEGDAASGFSIGITFTADGAAKMLDATRDHIGWALAILIDGEVVAAPVVRSPISTSAIIDGSFTRAEAERIVAGILSR
jgi:hypothetical protein